MANKKEKTDNDILLQSYKEECQVLSLTLRMACDAIPTGRLISGDTYTEPSVLRSLAQKRIQNEED